MAGLHYLCLSLTRATGIHSDHLSVWCPVLACPGQVLGSPVLSLTPGDSVLSEIASEQRDSPLASASLAVYLPWEGHRSSGKLDSLAIAYEYKVAE